MRTVWIMEDDEIVRRAMSILGSKTSALKAQTARENGTKPKKKRKSKSNANRSDIPLSPENKV